MTHVGAPCRTLAQHGTRRRSQSAQGYSGTLANHSRMLTDPSSGCSQHRTHSPWKLRDAQSGPPPGMEAGSRLAGGGADTFHLEEWHMGASEDGMKTVTSESRDPSEKEPKRPEEWSDRPSVRRLDGGESGRESAVPSLLRHVRRRYPPKHAITQERDYHLPRSEGNRGARFIKFLCLSPQILCTPRAVCVLVCEMQV